MKQIINTNTKAAHFAKIYHRIIVLTNQTATQVTDAERNFTFGFEERFASFFFKAYRDNQNGVAISPTWALYFQYDSLSNLQYQFIGMNAHINGDMWTALASRYNADSIKFYKQLLIGYQPDINQLFKEVYAEAVKYKQVKRLHRWTLGISKLYAKQMIYRWRKRQVNLAIWYTSKPAKFRRKLAKTDRKRLLLNRLALKHLR